VVVVAEGTVVIVVVSMKKEAEGVEGRRQRVTTTATIRLQ
jgi:hypothetical protein